MDVNENVSLMESKDPNLKVDMFNSLILLLA